MVVFRRVKNNVENNIEDANWKAKLKLPPPDNRVKTSVSVVIIVISVHCRLVRNLTHACVLFVFVLRLLSGCN